MNKTGKGTLTIGSDQQYTGATVLHDGVYEFSSIANGDVASGLGMSQEFAQNWVMDGGTYKYTGASAATNRSAMLYDATELNIDKSGTVLTMNGGIEGQGDLIVNGNGQLLVNNAKFFKYDGNVVLQGGELKLSNKSISDAGIGTASKLVMKGGKFTAIGDRASTVTFNFPIEVPAGTTSTVDFGENNSNKCSVTGSGTLIWNVHYTREYIEGNWDGFNGQLIINGTGSKNQSQFAMSKSGTGHDIKNATIYMKGTASLQGSKNQATYVLGGLSGDATTQLGGFNVKKNGTGTWVVGTANTNEEFRGIINNYAQDYKHKNSTSIEKQGTGDWRLTGNSDYAGTTTVTAGTLIVNGTHSGTGAVTVKSGATLAGKGTLAGKVTLNSGATLQVGDTLATDKGLTMSGGLTIQSNVKLVLNEAMQEATHYNNDKIQVFIGTVTGTFAEIIPATPGEGQTWDTSALYTDGILTVVGGEERPEEPEDPEPESDTQKVCIAWGNCTRTGGDSSCTELVGNEADPSNNIGYSMHYTTVTNKYYSKGEKMTYDFDGTQRTGIKLSNGAQNTIVIPDGHKVTKITFWSVVGTNINNRTSYWKEVAGQTYTEADGQIFDLTKTATAPNKAEFVLNNVQKELTFTNTGEQQSVIIVLEYHTGGSDADAITNVQSVKMADTDAIYNLSGQKVDSNYRGIVIKNGKKYLY